MTAYGVGYLWNVNFGDAIIEYLQRIDATLEPFKARFIVHGGEIDLLEGDLNEGSAIIIEFPDIDHARRWYHSDAYAEIKALRTDNSNGYILIVDGVSMNHKAIDVLTN
jgi:uncharacterized protein (DUF1330 family)